MKKNIIFLVIIAVMAIAGVVAFIWSYSQMSYYRDNAEEIAFQASEAAKGEQHTIDEEIFDEKIKQPFFEFSGPSDFGSISFNYPRTWSAYNTQDSVSGYEVVFYPGVIPPLTEDTPVALRVEIVNKNYEDELNGYESSVKKGELTATPVTVNEDQEGVLLSGNINKNFTTSLILLKLRDKTLLIQTDTNKYLSDFEDVILASFKYAP